MSPELGQNPDKPLPHQSRLQTFNRLFKTGQARLSEEPLIRSSFVYVIEDNSQGSELSLVGRKRTLDGQILEIFELNYGVMGRDRAYFSYMRKEGPCQVPFFLDSYSHFL